MKKKIIGYIYDSFTEDNMSVVMEDKDGIYLKLLKGQPLQEIPSYEVLRLSFKRNITNLQYK